MGFSKHFICWLQNLIDCVTDEDDDDDDDDDFGYVFRDNMIAQFKRDLYNKNFSLQDQGKCDENDTLGKRIKNWLLVIECEGPILDNI